MKRTASLSVAGVALALCLALPGCKPPPGVERADQPTPTPTSPPAPTPEPSPTPIYIPRQILDTAKIYNGLGVESTFSYEPGASATTDRSDDGSFVFELKLKVRVPKAGQTLEALDAVTPDLPELLPGLAAMMPTARVSPFFEDLYARKLSYLENRLTRLDRLLTRHNFFDLETMLELEHPETGRKVLLAQSDMDVDADGSDSDRVAYVDGDLPYYQPMTSYKWDKKSDRPNPYLAKSQAELDGFRKEFAVPGLSAQRNRELKTGIDEMTYEIAQLKTKSFLISEHDPFVVIPGNFVPKRKEPFTPWLGDYAVVIHGGKIYPAIVGDVGPSFKMGEASLRLAKALNPKSNAYSRPVSDLTVTYIYFPGTADPEFGPPDLERYYQRCQELLAEIGGVGTELHRWENTIPPLPTPTPTPTPTPAPTATPGPSPSPSSTASPTPAPTVTPSPSPPPAESPTLSPTPAVGV